MDINELKTAWMAFDDRLKTSQRIQDDVIASMIAGRSSSRFSSVRRKYVLGIIWMTICLAAGVVVLLTNPFDYQYVLQYLPLIIYSSCLLILLVGMMRGYSRLNRITVEKNTLEASLRSIIKEYERPRRMMRYTLLVLLFTAVVLFPLSFLPPNLAKFGLGIALAERLMPMTISALLVFIAYKFGAFKERDVPGFKDDLTEFEQLKALSKELTTY